MSHVLVSIVVIIEDVVFTFNVDHHIWMVRGGNPRDLTRLIHELVLGVDLLVASESVLVCKLGVYLDPFGLDRTPRASTAATTPLLFPHALLLLPCSRIFPPLKHVRDGGHLMVSEEKGRHRVKQVFILLQVLLRLNRLKVENLTDVGILKRWVLS